MEDKYLELGCGWDAHLGPPGDEYPELGCNEEASYVH